MTDLLISTRTAAHTAATPTTPAAHPLLLTPTIVVALDRQGAEVCERLASLVRANIRGPRHHDARAARDRFGFIRLLRDPDSPGLTEVQAIAVDPSERLWNIADETWQYQPFQDQRSISFSSALRQTISDVLHYTLVEEELRDRNIMVQPSVLNVFFVGTLIHDLPLPLDELSVQATAPSDPSVPSALSKDVERSLDEIQEIAESVRLYAEESASLELVVRGAFLSLVLPVDSYALVRESVQRHGTTFGRLLTPPAAAEYADLVGYKEPPLHFCSLYTDHDDRGAWYDPQQLTNMMASAIYALMQSELMDDGNCATQLGLRDPYAGPYERIVSIAATRSSLPRADLLDYAALQYGAYLLDELLPDATGPLSSAERAQLKPMVDELVRQGDLMNLTERDDDALWDKHGTPGQLSSLGADPGYGPPDLHVLIPEPRTSWRSPWTEHVHNTLRELTRLDQLSRYLDIPLVDDDGAAIPLERPAGDGQFTYDQEPLLLEWHRWRQAMTERVDNPEHGEVMRRTLAVCQELDQRLWGDPPRGISFSSSRYCVVVLDLVNECMREVQGRIAARRLPAPPSEAQVEQELQSARERGLVRASLSVLVGLSVLLTPLLTYMFLAVRESAATDVFASLLRRPPLVLNLPGGLQSLHLPIALMLAAMASLTLLVIGLMIRQWQTLRAVSGMREYARLIRQKYALLMYRDEQQRIESIPDQILTYRQFLHRSAQAIQAAAHVGSQRLRERATAISDRGFRDVSEYLPMVRGGPQEIYQRLIKPRMTEHASTDLPRLRREARQVCSFADATVQTDERAIEQDAREMVNQLVVGDPTVSEQDPLARLRFLAYQSLQRDLEEVVQKTVTQQTLQRAQELQRRTHLMLRTGFREGLFAFQQAYLVAAVDGIDQKPALVETVSVRGLDPDMVMYVRIVNGVWPRLFEGAGVKLI